MATVSTKIRPEIADVLGQLRSRIRRYVVLEGSALLLTVLGAIFWASFTVDWLYFQLSSLELPRWFRASLAIGTVGLAVFLLLVWIVFRAFRSLRTKALALVLERRFPELDDRLVTAVEMADAQASGQAPLTHTMLRRTIDDVARAVLNLELSAVFDRRPIRRAVIGAAVILTSIGSLAAVNASAMERWVNSFVRLRDVYWDRETKLVVKVVAQPGDRVRELSDTTPYRHARGSDLTLLVEVPERDEATGKEWKVPDRIELSFRLDGGGGAKVYLTRVGDRQFRHTVGGLLDSLSLTVKGGDDASRRPYRVDVVKPPEVDQFTLWCDFPDYTGLDQPSESERFPDLTERVVQGTHMSLPIGTTFELQADCNKSLVQVQVQTDRFELRFSRRDENGDVEAVALLKDSSGDVERQWTLPDAYAAMLDDGGTSFTVPCVVAHDFDAQFASAVEGKWRWPIPPESLIRIYLEDTDEILGSDPSRLTIGGTIDQPPEIESARRGIGRMITRKASIPIEGRIRDDYGIAAARFSYRIDDQPGWRPREFTRSPSASPLEFVLQRSDEEAVERFEVLPLELKVGQQLRLSVYAEDGDSLLGPNKNRGEVYTFKIVSDLELLSVLYAKELNLRTRFEQIMAEVTATREQLERAEQQYGTVADMARDEAADTKEMADLRKTVAATADRTLHQIRKNANETTEVEHSFREILEELVNNAVHTAQMVKRLDDLIVEPLKKINEIDYHEVDKALSRYKLDMDDRRDPRSNIRRSIRQIDVLLDHMQRVLSEMQDLMKFHQALEELKQIIEAEEKLMDETKRRRLRDLGIGTN